MEAVLEFGLEFVGEFAEGVVDGCDLGGEGIEGAAEGGGVVVGVEEETVLAGAFGLVASFVSAGPAAIDFSNLICPDF
mgnify:CR=1 FL=1